MPATDGNIFAALSAVMGDIGAIAKEQVNTFDRYQFRGIDDVYNALQPALVKHGVLLVPTLEALSRSTYSTKKGEQYQLVTVDVRYNLIATDGSQISVRVPGEGSDRSDKAVNKAMSAAYKLMAFQVFCIPTEEAHDSEHESPPPAAAEQAPPKPGPGEKANALKRMKATKIGFGVHANETWGWLLEGEPGGHRAQILDGFIANPPDGDTFKRAQYVRGLMNDRADKKAAQEEA
jgi:hypothetical protein